jgi:hypothetical protein
MHPLSKNNLLSIARNITYIMNNVDNIDMHDELFTKECSSIEEKIEEYCMECIRVPTLDDYYGYKIHTGIIASNIHVPRQESILLSSCDLYDILTIINTHRHIDNSNRSLYKLIDNNINKLSKEHTFMILNVSSIGNPDHNNNHNHNHNINNNNINNNSMRGDTTEKVI